VSRRLLCALPALAALVLAPAAAQARVLEAESVLPPGQSGYVSIPGVASGTGSPHLNDQTDLFKAFRFKDARFGQPGGSNSPRPGVTITRDRYGVPSIRGASDYDAWWGVGYAVAEDRLFQLELFRRATSGRLAEILGEEYLDDDLIARRDYYTDEEVNAQLARVPRNLQRRGEAYRDGINAYIERVRRRPTELPGEFVALGITPEDWSLTDSGRIGVFLARTVPSGDGVELENARVLDAIGPRAFTRLLPLRTPGRINTVPRRNGIFPSQPGRTRRQERRGFTNSRRFLEGLSLPSEESAGAATSAGRSAGRILGRRGSYMWAISRRRPATRRRRARAGEAYLFNGPQLGFSIPELFVEYELHSPVQDVRGVSAAGVPVVGIGHNGRVAWGFTSGLSDEDDLYAEQLTGDETYRFRGREERMSCRNERFTFRASPPDLPDLVLEPSKAAGERTERICRTVHGPVQVRGNGRAYARRYAIWNREIETLLGLSILNDANDIRDVDRAMLNVTWNENVIAADSAGNIGYWHPGLHPLRPRNFDERLPYPGTGEAEWRGLLPRRRTPYVINPRSGYVSNWNNVPSAGWTNGDSEARERATGPFHRSRWLDLLVRRVKRRPSYAASRDIDKSSGTVAQQRPVFGRQLQRARLGGTSKARSVLGTLVKWSGDYHGTAGDGTVDSGVAAWEELKDQAEAISLFRLGPGVKPLAGQTSNSHMFDITLGEAHALRTLPRASLRLAAERTADALTRRFGSADPLSWREERRQYPVSAQGAGATPELPFFDRGTWEQSVKLGP
jgi:acyl-homoserine lactone acylase PvdQ